MSRLCWIAALLAATMVATAAPAAASGWQPFVELAAPGQTDTALDEQVVALPDGGSLIAWTLFADGNAEDGHVQLRRIAPDGTPGPIVNLTQPGSRSYSPELGAGSDGRVFATWQRFRDPADTQADRVTLEGRWISASGQFGAVIAIDGDVDIDWPKVAIAPDGTATVAWAFSGIALDRGAGAVPSYYRIRARRVAASGVAGPHLDLSDTGLVQLGEDKHVDLVVDGQGRATITWLNDPSASYTNFVDDTGRLQAVRSISAAGVVGPYRLLNETAGGEPVAGRDPFGAKLAVAPDGTLTAVWVSLKFNHDDVFDDDRGVKFRRLSPSGELGAFGYLEPAQADAGLGQMPDDWDVATAADGTSTAVWNRELTLDGTADTASSALRAARIGPAGAASAAFDVVGDLDDLTNPALGIRPGGDAVVVWSAFDDGLFSVASRALAPSGALGPLSVLSSPQQPAAYSRLAVGTDGTATAAWAAVAGAGFTIQAARNVPDPPPPNAPPVCAAVSATPADIAQAKPDLFVRVRLAGATDPEGAVLSYHIDAVKQDEPVTGKGDTTKPDARRAGTEVELRAERSQSGDGRVYRLAYTVSDGTSACSGTVKVGVRRQAKTAAIETGSLRWDSFTGAPA
jgi:hypothetical protein